MFAGLWSGREMAALFGTLGDGAEVNLSGTLGYDMGVDTLSGHGFGIWRRVV